MYQVHFTIGFKSLIIFPYSVAFNQLQIFYSLQSLILKDLLFRLENLFCIFVIVKLNNQFIQIQSLCKLMCIKSK